MATRKTATQAQPSQPSQLSAAVQAVVGSAPVMITDASIPTLPALPAVSTVAPDDALQADFAAGKISAAEFRIKVAGLHATQEDARSLGYRWSISDQEQRLVIHRLVRLLKGADFAAFENVRLEFTAGHILGMDNSAKNPRAAADTAWNRAMDKVRAYFKEAGEKFEKPKSSKSSATRVLGEEAQAKADAKKAEKERLESLSIAEIKAEIKAEKDDVKRAALYLIKAKKEKAEADAAGKAEKDEVKKYREAIDNGLDTMSRAEVKSVLVLVNKIIASHQ